MVVPLRRGEAVRATAVAWHGRVWLWAAACGGLLACSGPSLEIASNRPTAAILLDGKPVGQGKAVLALPYYGTCEVAAVPAFADTNPAAGDTWRATRRLVEQVPPVTPWLFPLDFLGDLVTLPFRADHIPVEIELQRQPALTGDSQPPGIDGLRQRALAMRSAR
jgi:hypothetical protein